MEIIMENLSSSETSPELALQDRVREGEFNAEKQSASYWYFSMMEGMPLSTMEKAQLLVALKLEIPYLVSGVLERTCNLQCAHCLYQKEDSSAAISKQNHLDEVITKVVSTMPKADEGYQPKFMSVGRILRPSHLALFQKLRESREDVQLGVIDNGTYTRLLPKWPQGLKFDWIDISIDGTPEHHNVQRGAENAYVDAMNGLLHAREVTRSRDEGGYVSSLFTLTSINAGDIASVANTLLTPQVNGLPLVDVLKFTTMSPTNAENARIEISVEEIRIAWEALVEASIKYNTEERTSIDLGLYRIEDIEKLAAVVGEQKFLDALSIEGGVKVDRAFVNFMIDGVKVSYLPLSIWVPEEFLIEADGAHRVAYEGQFTLEELRAGVSKDGRDTKGFTVAQLTPEASLQEAYEKGVDHYWKNFGHKRLKDEFEVFARIRAKAEHAKE